MLLARVGRGHKWALMADESGEGWGTGLRRGLLGGDRGSWGQVPSLRPSTGSEAVPTDVLETADALRVVVDLPGVAPDDVEVIVERDMLTIRAVRSEPAPDVELVHRLGRTHGVRKTTVALPTPLDAGAARVEAAGGVVTVTFPKHGFARGDR